MKHYDYNKAKEIINNHLDGLKEVSLGMEEDWFWTGETIWEDGLYKNELNDEILIGGINGSNWATPIIRLTFEDGSETELDCYY